MVLQAGLPPDPQAAAVLLQVLQAAAALGATQGRAGLQQAPQDAAVLLQTSALVRSRQAQAIPRLLQQARAWAALPRSLAASQGQFQEGWLSAFDAGFAACIKVCVPPLPSIGLPPLVIDYWNSARVVLVRGRFGSLSRPMEEDVVLMLEVQHALR